MRMFFDDISRRRMNHFFITRKHRYNEPGGRRERPGLYASDNLHPDSDAFLETRKLVRVFLWQFDIKEKVMSLNIF